MPQLRIQVPGILLVAALFVPWAWPQQPARGATKQKSDAAKPDVTVITGVSVVTEHGAPALEILSTRPAVPQIQFLDSPPRLVIDLLHAQIGLKEKKIEVNQENILAIRAEQFQNDPPIARVVLDLLAPYTYTWDEAGNRLMVRLKTREDTPAKNRKPPLRAPAAPSLSPERTMALVPVAGGSGDILLAGSRIAAGSSLSTGPEATILQLERGGEMRLCPRTTVSVTPSRNANDLLIGMSTGALEIHYSLNSSADTVVTPDFRILFAGPGEFDFALSADSRGDTCVRGLPGNGSSAIVTELIGDRTYQVKPGEQAVFRAGRIDKVDTSVPPGCGCPRAVVPSTQPGVASASEPSSPPNATLSAAEGSGKNTDGASAPSTQSSGLHIQIDAPLVFHGKPDAGATSASAQPAPIPQPVKDAADLPVTQPAAAPAQLTIQVQPPAAPQASTPQDSAPHRFLRRLKGFFGAIFH